jgi:predicted  nucleic acid-binding Zn-ribbon protein
MAMLICVECGEMFEDFSDEVKYFICFECLAEDVG